MKIAFVCPYDISRPGGVKSHIISLSRYLRIIGHQVKIIAPNINANLVVEKEIYFFGKNKSLNIGGTKIDINIAFGEDKKRLKKFISENNFDIIHYHTIWNPLLSFQVLRYSNAKQVATFHDTPKSKFVGKWIMPMIARGVFMFLDQIISVSQSQSEFISRFSRRNIHLIPNGIDLEEIRSYVPKNNIKKTEFFQMLFLGRLEPRKGVMHALYAFEELKLRYPQMKLIIAGDGDGRMEVDKYIRDHSIQDVKLLGFVDNKLKYRLLKESDLYLAPALYGESFGIVLLEAMAVGTPIAGYANEGYKNVIISEMMEGFADPGNLDQFIQCIERLIPFYKRKKLIMHGLREVKKYDWAVIFKEVNKIYMK